MSNNLKTKQENKASFKAQKKFFIPELIFAIISTIGLIYTIASFSTVSELKQQSGGSAAVGMFFVLILFFIAEIGGMITIAITFGLSIGGFAKTKHKAQLVFLIISSAYIVAFVTFFAMVYAI